MTKHCMQAHNINYHDINDTYYKEVNSIENELLLQTRSRNENVHVKDPDDVHNDETHTEHVMKHEISWSEIDDILRETKIRYLGYLHVISNSFRPHIPTGIFTSGYQISRIYFLSDVIHKSYRSIKETKEDILGELQKSMQNIELELKGIKDILKQDTVKATGKTESEENKTMTATPSIKRTSGTDEVAVDMYRDTYVRYLGYANELGEAFRPLVPKTVVAGSYGVACVYVLGDTFDKSIKAGKTGTIKSAAVAAGDTLLWQGFASVIIPGFTINRITYFTSKLVKKSDKFGKFGKIVPTLVGILSIPLIIRPIDHAVDIGMDYTYRKWFSTITKPKQVYNVNANNDK